MPWRHPWGLGGTEKMPAGGGGPPAVMHQRLCGWIDPGKSGRAEMDTLCGYVWPKPACPGTMRKRRWVARKALEELRGIGWTVEEYAPAKHLIHRPPITHPRHNGNAPPS